MTRPWLVLSTLWSLATGCAAHATAASTAHREPEASRAAVVTESPARTAVVSESPARPPGPLTRAEVEALLQRGLGPLLARVEVSPVLVAGRFVGFRLDAAQDLDAWRAAGADIRLGDVIVRVNGIRIERPEQAQWAFERLRIARAIEVDVLRAGAPVAVRSPILDATASSTRE